MFVQLAILMLAHQTATLATTNAKVVLTHLPVSAVTHPYSAVSTQLPYSANVIATTSNQIKSATPV